MVENEIDYKIKCLRFDRGVEFTSNKLDKFCEDHGIRRNLFSLRTPQQNGVVERKNRTIQEMIRTMLKDANVSDVYWKVVVHTSVYILNRVQLRVNNSKAPSELWYARISTIMHFKNFGRKCYIRRDEEKLGKFVSRCDGGILLGYSTRRNAYRGYNKRLRKIVEIINIKVDKYWIQIKQELEDCGSKEPPQIEEEEDT